MTHYSRILDSRGKPLVKPILDSYGESGLEQYAGRIYEEWQRALQGPNKYKVFREMADNDAIIGAVLYGIEFLLRTAKPRFKPKDESIGEARELADFIRDAYEDRTSTHQETMSEIITQFVYGFAPLEIEYKIRMGPSFESKRLRSDYSDRRIGWLDFSLRSQESTEEWLIDSDGDWYAYAQRPAPNYTRHVIPEKRLMNFRWRSHKKNPEGRSVLRNAWRSWFYLKRLQEFEAIGIERNLAGLPVFEVPPAILGKGATADQVSIREDLAEIAARVRFNEFGGLIVPSKTNPDGSSTGYSFSLVSASGRNNAEPNTPIVRYETRITQVVLADFINLGNMPNGSRALADTKTSLFSVMLGSFLQGIADTISKKAIPELVRLNGLNTNLLPYMEFEDLDERDISTTAAFVTQGVQNAWLTPDRKLEEFMRELIPGMPDAPTDSVATLDHMFREAKKAADSDRFEWGLTEPSE